MCTVMPAKAGIQFSCSRSNGQNWIPAFAGMTNVQSFP